VVCKISIEWFLTDITLCCLCRESEEETKSGWFWWGGGWWWWWSRAFIISAACCSASGCLHASYDPGRHPSCCSCPRHATWLCRCEWL